MEVKRIMKKPLLHPLQPLYFDQKKMIRFKKNNIVRFLFEDGNYDMNSLDGMGWDVEDREQFLQLIGYSVDGINEISYLSDHTYQRIVKAVKLFEKQGDDQA